MEPLSEQACERRWSEFLDLFEVWKHKLPGAPSPAGDKWSKLLDEYSVMELTKAINYAEKILAGRTDDISLFEARRNFLSYLQTTEKAKLYMENQQ